MFSDEMIHRAFRTPATLQKKKKKKTFEKIYIFTIYQNYTLALKSVMTRSQCLQGPIS